jgi:hypothetical protein
MESLGIHVSENFINIGLVDKSFGSAVTGAWKRLEPLTLNARRNLPDPFLNEYFQWLAEHMQQEVKKADRKPFYQNVMS